MHRPYKRVSSGEDMPRFPSRVPWCSVVLLVWSVKCVGTVSTQLPTQTYSKATTTTTTTTTTMSDAPHHAPTVANVQEKTTQVSPPTSTKREITTDRHESTSPAQKTTDASEVDHSTSDDVLPQHSTVGFAPRKTKVDRDVILNRTVAPVTKNASLARCTTADNTEQASPTITLNTYVFVVILVSTFVAAVVFVAGIFYLCLKTRYGGGFSVRRRKQRVTSGRKNIVTDFATSHIYAEIPGVTLSENDQYRRHPGFDTKGSPHPISTLIRGHVSPDAKPAPPACRPLKVRRKQVRSHSADKDKVDEMNTSGDSDSDFGSYIDQTQLKLEMSSTVV